MAALTSSLWMHIERLAKGPRTIPRFRSISPVRQQAFGHQIPGSVELFVVVFKLGLDGVGGEQYGCLWWTVDFIAQDALLHLQEEKLLGDALDQLLGHILRKELGPKFELQRVLLLDILRCDLMRKHRVMESMLGAFYTRWNQRNNHHPGTIKRPFYHLENSGLSCFSVNWLANFFAAMANLKM